MIIALKNGGQLVISECPWLRDGAVYLAAGNMRGSQGVIIQPVELDQTIAELTRIRAVIAERASERERKKRKAA